MERPQERPQSSRLHADDCVAVEITDLVSSAQRAAAVLLLADAMGDNPLHIQAFGADPARRQRRLRRFMNPLLHHVQSHGALLGAHAQGELVGVLGMMRPGCCRPSAWAALRFAGVVVASNPPIGVWRIARWMAAWARHDPSELHWHIGPLRPAPAKPGCVTANKPARAGA